MVGTIRSGDRAVTIGDKVWNARRETDDGRVGWLGFDTNDGMTTATVTDGLYRGQLGVGVFFAALAAAEENRFAGRARTASEQLLDAESPGDESLGLGNGLGGLVYGLSLVSEFLSDSRFADRAIELIEEYPNERISEDDRYDVLHGAAGAILAAIKLYDRTGDRMPLEFAERCGDHLMDSRYDKWGFGVWDTDPSSSYRTTSVGMGHGVAGIALALARLGARTNRTEFSTAAMRTVRFENTFYSERKSRWKSNWRSVPNYPPWWCYGTPGIGAARLGMPSDCSQLVERDVRRAIAFDPSGTAGDSLCHGMCSRIDFRLGVEADERFESSITSNSLVQQLVASQQNTGNFDVPLGSVESLTNPSLFVGLSGIGYTLLRHQHPNTIPSLLRLH